MKNIIQQIVSKAVEKILEYYESHGGIHDLSEMAEDIKQITDELGQKTLRVFIENADKAIREARSERLGDGIRIRQSNVQRELFTALGQFIYERTYFDTLSGREYIIDNILGVTAYERVDAGVSAKLVNAAAYNSYERSADIVTGGKISRQSVRNKAINTGEIVHIPEAAMDAPEALHIFADEDHVHLQSGKNVIVPLVTVCEGKKTVSAGRNELIQPFHIQGYGLEPSDLWEYVYAVCAEKYDMERVKKVYIYGDGAAWIKRSFDVFPEALHVLDEFHLKKRLRGLLSGEICAPFRLNAHNAIGKNDKYGFDRAVQSIINSMEKEMPTGKERDKKIQKIKEHAGYIMAHWDAIQNRKLPGSIGSCTEAMVSHVLSERFSRSPMGWSPAGLSKMAMIRVFVLNGGKVKPADVTAWKRKEGKDSVITKFEKYEKIVRDQQDEVLKDVKNWRWFETDDMISGKRTGTRVALDSLARTKKIS